MVLTIEFPVKFNFALQTVELNSESWIDYQLLEDTAMINNWYQGLAHELNFEPDDIPLGGERFVTPRTVSWITINPKHNYTYSRRTLRPKPLEQHPTLMTIFHFIQSVYGHAFNGVLCNHYANGDDHISFHTDDEPALGHNPTIVSISLQHPECQ